MFGRPPFPPVPLPTTCVSNRYRSPRKSPEARDYPVIGKLSIHNNYTGVVRNSGQMRVSFWPRNCHQPGRPSHVQWKSEINRRWKTWSPRKQSFLCSRIYCPSQSYLITGRQGIHPQQLCSCTQLWTDFFFAHEIVAS